MKKIITTIILFFNILLPAQEYFKLYQYGLRLLKENDTNNAIISLKESINKSPNHYALNLLGDIFISKKDTSSAYNYYKKSFDNDTNYISSFKLGEINFYKYQFEKAQIFYTKFLEYAPKNSSYYNAILKRIKNCSFAKKAIKNPVNFTPKSVGDKLNTNLFEYSPSISSNQKMIIYTRLDIAQKGHKFENIYYSKLINNQWQEGEILPGKINSKFNEGGACLSANGKFMFFTGCNRDDGKGSCDIYFSVLNDQGWGIPVNLNSPVNSKYWDSNPSLSPDGKTLYFLSNRPGGKGKKDIWYSEFKYGKWGNPKNLSVLNTPENEETPFIHIDNSTLYFCSDGWEGMGDLDFFVSKKDSIGNWSKPENLGYPINSIFEDYGLTVARDGKTAFFSKNSKEKKDLDIYYFELPENKRAKPTGYIKGYVVNENGKILDNAKMSIYDIYSGKEVESFELENGKYFGTLSQNKTYAFQVIQKNYMIYSQNVTINDSLDLEFDINLSEIKKDEIASLNNILFEFDKSTLKKESFLELERVIEFLNINPNIYIELGGHTDNNGTESYNKNLSSQRAKAVYNYLIKKGISKERLSYDGYGFSKPLNDNVGENKQKLNRRTEIKITKIN